jgi:hypothetical protein
MDQRKCVSCGNWFPVNRSTHMACSNQCAQRKRNQEKLDAIQVVKKTVSEPPLYSKGELYEARHHIKLYDTPELAKGREYVLIKSHRIVEYWANRQKLEDFLVNRRAELNEEQNRRRERKRNKQNDTPTQPVS